MLVPWLARAARIKPTHERAKAPFEPRGLNSFRSVNTRGERKKCDKEVVAARHWGNAERGKRKGKGWGVG